MKISQNFTQQEITPSDAKLNWNRNSVLFWLYIIEGLIVIKTFDDHLSLKIDNPLNKFGQGSFTGSLINRTSGTICPILPKDHFSIDLNPENHYVLLVTQTFNRADNVGYWIETRTLDFEPD